MAFHFRLEDHGVAPFIRMLVVKHPGVVSKALNRVVFEIREEEARMTAHAFDFWSAVTKNFLANKRSFPFEPASPSRLVAKVHTGVKTSEIMVKQESGFTLKPGEGKQLELGSAYAIPTTDAAAQLKTPRGTVRPSQTPGALIKGTTKLGLIKIKRRRRSRKNRTGMIGTTKLGTHVFLSPNRKAIIEVTPGGGRRILYGLYEKNVEVREHTEFFNTAARAIGVHMIPKLLQEWDRSFGRF